MKRFLIKLIWFIGVLVLVNFLLLRVVKSIYISDYASVSLSKKTYLLADSHGAALDTLTKKYGVENFSNRSDSYIDLERKVNYLVRNGAPKTIYLTADAHMLSPDREAYNNNMLSANFTNRTDYNNFFVYLLKVYIEPNTVYFNKKYAPLLRTYAKSLLKKPHTSSTFVEWQNLERSEQKQKSEERFRVYFASEEKSTTLKNSLQRIISLCKKHNIEVIGVKFPLSPSYNNVIKDRNFGADTVFAENGLPVLNFQESMQQEYFFKDQDHLNDLGAKHFTELLFE